MHAVEAEPGKPRHLYHFKRFGGDTTEVYQRSEHGRGGRGVSTYRCYLAASLGIIYGEFTDIKIIIFFNFS